MNDLKISVVGLGTIGTKLVIYFLTKGIEVNAFTSSEIEKKKQVITNALAKRHPDDYSKLLENLNLTNNLSSLSQSHLVIDSTIEDYQAKKELYQKFKPVLNPDILIATTTSSLNLTVLEEYCAPFSLMGLHFFNPPEKMRLIEVCLPVTENPVICETIQKLKAVMDDKVMIEMPRIQGYICNRLLFIYINAAFEYHLSTGIGIEEIDRAMELGTNVPMGPFKLSDYIGNDVTLSILAEFYHSLKEDSYKPSTLIETMVAESNLGRKTKRGFYSYE